MHAVSLVQGGVRGNTFQEERVKAGFEPACEIGEDRFEFGGVIRPQIGRRPHADQQDRYVPICQPTKDRFQIGRHLRRLETAQAVIRAQFHDHRVGPGAQRPVEAGQPAGAGVARNAGVFDDHIMAACCQCGLQLGWKGVRRSNAQAGGQAVAQGHDPHRVTGRRRPSHQAHQHQPGTATLDRFCKPAISVHVDFTFRNFLPVTGHALDLKDIHLTLGSEAGPVNILRGIDLVVPAGQSLGIVGPSGSGKSTLLMVMGGLERVTTGTVIAAGRDITDMNEDALAAFRLGRVGVVFQSFHLIPTMNALENVAVPLEIAGRGDAFDVAHEALGRVGLDHRLSHYPGQLSGGEQQRVALARALAPAPAILLADEPTGNLDGATGQQIIDLLFGMAREAGTTLVLVTHDKDLTGHCDRTVRLEDGRIVSDIIAAGAAA